MICSPIAQREYRSWKLVCECGSWYGTRDWKIEARRLWIVFWSALSGSMICPLCRWAQRSETGAVEEVGDEYWPRLK